MLQDNTTAIPNRNNDISDILQQFSVAVIFLSTTAMMKYMCQIPCVCMHSMDFDNGQIRSLINCTDRDLA